MTWFVRPMKDQDRTQWAVLWQEYNAFYGRIGNEGQSKILWQRLLQQESGVFGLVACDDEGDLVGIAHFFFHPTTLSMTDKCYMQDLYVSPHQRSGGVGRALIEAVAKKASEAGADELYWLTQEHNRTARVLYDKVGELTAFIKYRRNVGA